MKISYFWVSSRKAEPFFLFDSLSICSLPSPQIGLGPATVSSQVMGKIKVKMSRDYIGLECILGLDIGKRSGEVALTLETIQS